MTRRKLLWAAPTMTVLLRAPAVRAQVKYNAAIEPPYVSPGVGAAGIRGRSDTRDYPDWGIVSRVFSKWGLH